MNVLFNLSKPGDYFPVYRKPVPVELFRLESGIFFDSVYGLFREYFPDAEHTVIGEGGTSVVSEINDKCDLLSVPSFSLFTRVLVYAAFCASRRKSGFCLFHPANVKARDMDIFAPVIRKAVSDPVISDSLVFYSFGQGRSDFFIEKGEKVSGEAAAVKSFKTAGEIALWKEKNKYQDEKNFFCAGSGVFSFNPVHLAEKLTSENEDLRTLYHLLVGAWEDETTVGDIPKFLKLLQESAQVLDGFDFMELVKKTDEKFTLEVGTGLDRVDSFGDMLPFLPLDAQGNYVSGDAELERVFRSAVINRGHRKIRVSGMNDVLVLSDDSGTNVRSINR